MGGIAGYRFGPYELRLDRYALLRDGREIELRPKAFDTLRVLVENAGRAMSKDALVEAVWPDVIVNDDALSQCVRDVRRALGEDAGLVRTLPKRGYVFEGSPAQIAARGARPGWLPALLLLPAALALWLLWPAAPAGDGALTIAVLPFETSTEDGTDRWLGEGIAEDVTLGLTRFADLRVIGSASSARYGGPRADPAEIREALGADYVLLGSVRRDADAVRLAVQLIDARTDRILWADRTEAPVARIAETRDALVDGVASRLSMRMREDGAARARATGDPASYALTLRARRAYGAFDRAGASQGLALARRAVDADPSNAAAWDILARLLVQFYVQPYDERRGDAAVLAEAVEAARRARALDPADPRAMATLALLLTWQGAHDAAIPLHEAAMALSPADASLVHAYADTLGRAGRHEEAIGAFARARRLDPFEIPLNLGLEARSHLLSGDARRALDLAERCLAAQPRMLPCHLFRIMAARELGRRAIAEESAEAVRALAPRFTVGGWRDIIRFGDPADAARMTDWLVEAGLTP